jgi:hypothetical protein
MRRTEVLALAADTDEYWALCVRALRELSHPLLDPRYVQPMMAQMQFLLGVTGEGGELVVTVPMSFWSNANGFITAANALARVAAGCRGWAEEVLAADGEAYVPPHARVASSDEWSVREALWRVVQATERVRYGFRWPGKLAVSFGIDPPLPLLAMQGSSVSGDV